jgi:hypothetical protein
MGLYGLAAFGVELPGWDRLGRARGVGNVRPAFGVPRGVEAARVGEAVFREFKSVAVTPTYLLARDPAVIGLSSGFFFAGAGAGAGIALTGAKEGVVRPDTEGVVRPLV